MMSASLSLRYLPDDMVRTALGLPPAKPHWSKKTRVGVESLIKSEHREKPNVKKYLHTHPTTVEMIEATGVERSNKQRLAALQQKLEKRERQLVELNKRAKCNSVIFTEFGAFERRDDILPSLHNGPSSKEKKKKAQCLPTITKDARKTTGVQTSMRNVTQVSTQTSSPSSKRLLSNRAQSKPATISRNSTMVSSPSRRHCLSDSMGTTKSSAKRRILPTDRVRASRVAQPMSSECSYTSADSDCSRSYRSARSIKSTDVSGVNSLSSLASSQPSNSSSSSSGSNSSSGSGSEVSVDTVRKEFERKHHEWMVTEETVALEKLIELQKKKLAQSQSHLKMYKVELVKKEMADEKRKDEAIRKLAEEKKRNIALKALLKTVEDFEKQHFPDEESRRREIQNQREKFMMMASFMEQDPTFKPTKPAMSIFSQLSEKQAAITPESPKKPTQPLETKKQKVLAQEPVRNIVVQEPSKKQASAEKFEKKSSTSHLVLKEVVKVPSVDDVPTPAETSRESIVKQSSSTAAAVENWESLKEKFDSAMATIEQLRQGVVDMFMPKLAGKVDFGERKVPTKKFKLTVPSTPSHKSSVEKLPNVVRTTPGPVNLTAASLTADAEEVVPAKQPLLARKSSLSIAARNEVVKMWNDAVGEAEAKELAEKASQVIADRKASLDKLLKEHLILPDQPAQEEMTKVATEEEAALPEEPAAVLKRQPTPPMYVTPRYASAQSFSSQMSLSTISETSPANFHQEFISPLATHSHQAVRPDYCSRGGLRSQLLQSKVANTEQKKVEKNEETEREMVEGETLDSKPAETCANELDETTQNEEAEEEGRAMVPYHSTKTRLHLSGQPDAVKTESDEAVNLPKPPPCSPVASCTQVALSNLSSGLSEQLSSSYHLQQLYELSEKNITAHSKENVTTVISDSITCLTDEEDELERQKTIGQLSVHDDDLEAQQAVPSSVSKVSSPSSTTVEAKEIVSKSESSSFPKSMVTAGGENEERVSKSGSSSSQKSIDSTQQAGPSSAGAIASTKMSFGGSFRDDDSAVIASSVASMKQLSKIGSWKSSLTISVDNEEECDDDYDDYFDEPAPVAASLVASEKEVTSPTSTAMEKEEEVSKSASSSSQKSMVASQAILEVEKEERVAKSPSSSSQKSTKVSSTSLKSKDSKVIDSLSTAEGVKDEMVARSDSNSSQKSTQSFASLKSKDSAQSLKQAETLKADTVSKSESNSAQKSMMEKQAVSVEQEVARSASLTSRTSSSRSSNFLKSREESAQSLKQAETLTADTVSMSESNSSQKSMMSLAAAPENEEMVARSDCGASQKPRKSTASLKYKDSAQSLKQAETADGVPQSGSSTSQKSMMDKPVTPTVEEEVVARSASLTSRTSSRRSSNFLKSREESAQSLKQAETTDVVPKIGSSTSQKSIMDKPPTPLMKNDEKVAKSESSSSKRSSSSLRSNSLGQTDVPEVTITVSGSNTSQRKSSTSLKSRDSAMSMKLNDSSPAIALAQHNSSTSQKSTVDSSAMKEEVVAISKSNSSHKSRNRSSTSLNSKHSSQSLKQAGSTPPTEVQNEGIVAKRDSSTSRRRSSTSVKSMESAPLVSSHHSLKHKDTPVAAPAVDSQELVARSTSSCSRKSKERGSSASLKPRRSTQLLKQEQEATITKSESCTSRKGSSTSLKSLYSEVMKERLSTTTSVLDSGEMVAKSGSRISSSTSLKSKHSEKMPATMILGTEQMVATSGSTTSQRSESRQRSSTSLKSKRSVRSLQREDTPATTILGTEGIVAASGSTTSVSRRRSSSTSLNGSSTLRKTSSTSLKSKDSAPLVSSAHSLKRKDLPVAAAVEIERTLPKIGSSSSHKSGNGSSSSLKSKYSRPVVPPLPLHLTTGNSDGNEPVLLRRGSNSSQKSKVSSSSLKSLAKNLSNLLPSRSLERKKSTGSSHMGNK